MSCIDQQSNVYHVQMMHLKKLPVDIKSFRYKKNEILLERLER